MTDRWNLLTTSYAGFRPEYGVPFQTSIGTPKNFAYPKHDLKVLMPFVTFRKPKYNYDMKAAAARYKQYLHEKKVSVERALDSFTDTYPGEPLVMLCYESRNAAMGGECHRRWFADWVEAEYGFWVPEAGVLPPAPVVEPEPTLF